MPCPAISMKIWVFLKGRWCFTFYFTGNNCFNIFIKTQLIKYLVPPIV